MSLPDDFGRFVTWLTVFGVIGAIAVLVVLGWATVAALRWFL